MGRGRREQHRQKREDRRRQRNITLGVVGGLLVAVIAGLIIMNVVRQQKEADRIAAEEAEQEARFADFEETDSGLRYNILEEGDGPRPEFGDTVLVHYRGTLLDGTQFDSSYDRGQPYEVQLGITSVIDGWTEGLALLNEGTRAELLIPPDLAYGASGQGDIPPDATLLFEVELVEVIPAE